MCRRKPLLLSHRFFFFSFYVLKVALGVGNPQAQKYTFPVLLSQLGCELMAVSCTRLGLASGPGARQYCVGLAEPGGWRTWPGSEFLQSARGVSRPVLDPGGGLGSSKLSRRPGQPQGAKTNPASQEYVLCTQGPAHLGLHVIVRSNAFWGMTRGLILSSENC